MVRISNNLLGLLNILTFLLSIPILGGGIWLSTRSSGTLCDKFLEKPMIVLGVFLLLISLAGLIGACCRVTWLLWVYLLVLFILIVVLFCFTIFAFLVTSKGEGEVIIGVGFEEYRLEDFSHWLQKRVDSNKNWEKIKSCLHDGLVCDSLVHVNNEPQGEFYRRNLTPTESGCCKPPLDCHFTYKSPTVWTKNPTNSTNPDCETWSDNTDLCFDCKSCKAGVLATLQTKWRKIAILNIIFFIFLLIVNSIGCCAFRNNRIDNATPRWRGYQ